MESAEASCLNLNSPVPAHMGVTVALAFPAVPSARRGRRQGRAHPGAPVTRRESLQPRWLAVTSNPLGLHRAFPCLLPPSPVRQPCLDAMGVQSWCQGNWGGGEAPAAAFCCHSNEVGNTALELRD